MKEYISESRSRVLIDDRAEAVRSFQRVTERMRDDRTNDGGERLASCSSISSVTNRSTGLPIRSRGRVYFLDIDDIDLLEAADNYVKVHADRKTHVVRQTLQTLEESLSPRGFIRVHRSVIVNIARIREIQSWFGGEYMVLLRDGTRLTSSRGYRSRIQALMD